MSASTVLTPSDAATMNSYEAMVSTDPNWASKLQGIVDPAVMTALQTYSQDANLLKADAYGAANTQNFVSTQMATPQQLFGADFQQGDKENPAFIDAQMSGKSTAGIQQWLTPQQVASGISYLLPNSSGNSIPGQGLASLQQLSSYTSGLPSAASASTPKRSQKNSGTSAPAATGAMTQTQADNAVTQMFQQYLGRAPASSGLQNYASALMNGTPASQIQQAISNSTEAKLYAETGTGLTPYQAQGFASLTPQQQQAQIQYYDPSNPNVDPGSFTGQPFGTINYNNQGGANAKPTSGFDPNGMTFQQLADAVNAHQLPQPTSGGTPNTTFGNSVNWDNLTFDGVPLTALGYSGGSNPGTGQILLGSGTTNTGWDYNGQPISVTQQGELYDMLANNQLNRNGWQFGLGVLGGALAGTVAAAGGAAGGAGGTVGEVGSTGTGAVGATGTGVTDLGGGFMGSTGLGATGTGGVGSVGSVAGALGSGAYADLGYTGATAAGAAGAAGSVASSVPSEGGVQTVVVNGSRIPVSELTPTQIASMGGASGVAGLVASQNPQVVNVTSSHLPTPAPTPTPTTGSGSDLQNILVGMGLSGAVASQVASGSGSGSNSSTSSDQNNGLTSSLSNLFGNGNGLSSLSSLLGPLISGYTQSQAANNALGLQQSMFNTTQANAAPYINAGKIAAGQISAGTQPGGQYVVPAYQDFTLDKFHQDPGYAFQLQQGQNALTNASSLTGGMNSNNLKGLIGYTQGLANTDYQQALSNYMAQYQQGADTIQQNFGNVESIAQLGANAGQGLGSQGVQVGSNLASNIMGAGNAISAGISGAATGYANSQVNAQNQALQQQYLTWLQNQGSSGTSIGG